MTYEANRPVKTSVRTFEIIEQLSRIDTVRVSRLADELDMNKGIVHNHLSTLRELGYVRKVDDGYQLTAKLLSVGLRARSGTRLYTVAHELIAEFSDRFDIGVVLCERAATDCIVIDVRRLPTTVDMTVGTMVPVSGSLVGLVLSATHDDKPTAATAAYDPAAIADAVDQQGYAVGPITSSTPLDCIAVPIVDETDLCHGCVGVVVPDGVSDQRSERLVEATIQLRARIETRLASGWEATRSFTTEKHSWIS